MQLRFFAGLSSMAPLAMAQASPSDGPASAQSSLPFKQAGNAAGPDGLAIVVITALAIILIVVLCFAWKRFGRGSPGEKPFRFTWRYMLQRPQANKDVRLTYVGQLNVRTSLHTVEWDGKSLLVASNEQFASVLLMREGEANKQTASDVVSTKRRT